METSLPTTSILEAALDLLDTLDMLDVIATANIPGKTANVRSQVRFFRSRKSVVKALMTSASGLKKRIHGAVSLVKFLLDLLDFALTRWAATSHVRAEKPEGAR